MQSRRYSKRSCICRCIWYLFLLSFLFFWISGAVIVYTRFSPSDDKSLVTVFTYVRHRIYKRWEKEALVGFPSQLEASITAAEINPASLSPPANVTDNEFLCAVFLRADPQQLKHMVANMDNIRSGCHWAVIATDGDASLFEKFKKTVSAIKNVKLIMYKFATPREELFKRTDSDKATQSWQAPLSFNNLSYPKPALLNEILPLAPRYMYIWLPHIRADLSHFSFRKFVKSVHCAYHPSLGPYVAQPLVKLRSSESSTWPRYMQFEAWRSVDDVYAVRSDYVSMSSAPMFRSDFFRWFVPHLSDPTLRAANYLGSEYMFDNVACAAAKNFGDKVVAASKKEAGIVPCAVIINSSPISLHDDEGGFADQQLLDGKMQTAIRNSFPTWFEVAEKFNSNPLLNSSIYRRSVRLSHVCLNQD